MNRVKQFVKYFYDKAVLYCTMFLCFIVYIEVRKQIMIQFRDRINNAWGFSGR